jgi:peptide deformylase
MPLVIFNPVVTKKEGKTTYDEGCLSVPGYFETVQRHEYVEVEGLDKNGQPLHLKLDGLLAICMQHEIDHLDGKVFLDRLSPIKSMRLRNKIKKYGYAKDRPPEEDEEEITVKKSAAEKV